MRRHAHPAAVELRAGVLFRRGAQRAPGARRHQELRHADPGGAFRIACRSHLCVRCVGALNCSRRAWGCLDVRTPRTPSGETDAPCWCPRLPVSCCWHPSLIGDRCLSVWAGGGTEEAGASVMATRWMPGSYRLFPARARTIPPRCARVVVCTPQRQSHLQCVCVCVPGAWLLMLRRAWGAPSVFALGAV
jgi:hypothetical protein